MVNLFLKRDVFTCRYRTVVAIPQVGHHVCPTTEANVGGGGGRRGWVVLEFNRWVLR